MFSLAVIVCHVPLSSCRPHQRQVPLEVKTFRLATWRLGWTIYSTVHCSFNPFSGYRPLDRIHSYRNSHSTMVNAETERVLHRVSHLLLPSKPALNLLLWRSPKSDHRPDRSHLYDAGSWCIMYVVAWLGVCLLFARSHHLYSFLAVPLFL